MLLQINNLSKTYANGVQALKNINLEIKNGMFGLLGPNGAGKSSLMRTIATLQEADSGSIKLNDIDVINQKNELRKVLGYLPQEFGVYPRTTAEEMLNHIAMMKGISKSQERKETVKALLHQVNLYEKRKKYLSSYSGGMRQRFGIAQALLGNPQLIIVDEPTAGLDPAERIRFNNLLSEIGENIIVILSTHIVDDVRELCSEMAIISNGEVLLKGNPAQLINDLDGKVWSMRIRKDELPDYQDKYNVIYSRLASGGLMLNVLSDYQPIGSFMLQQPSLEDVYFSRVKTA